MSQQSADLEKLSMLDEYGHKLRIYPAEIKGYFKKHKNWSQAVMILIFMILPWIKINGTQSVLLDITNRKFALFGVTFFAHDAPLIVFILAIIGFGLAFMTAVWGRVWCGWACPQTVFIEGLFRRIETWIEGTHLQRRALDQADLSFSKVFKKTLKWLLFFIISTHIAHSFLAYFIGAEHLLEISQSDPRKNWWDFVFVYSTAGILTFNFGWFREQFCVIMCPYGRFQSVLYDRKTVTVMYDESRGEPRKGSPAFADKKGDCVACNRCVQVCPTGIDIRNGIQMECIACTACIDACDEIMTKVKKPTGLIKYNSLDGTKAHVLRGRSFLYLFFVIISVLGLSYNILSRKPYEYLILRASGEAPYSTMKDAQGKDILLNHLRLHIKNQTFNDKEVLITTLPEWKDKVIELKMPESDLKLKGGEFKMIHFFVTFPNEVTKGQGLFKTQLLVDGQPQEITLVGPNQ